MATRNSQSIAQNIIQSIGDLIFRLLRGETVISLQLSRHSKQNEAQKDMHTPFQRAAAWASAIMAAPGSFVNLTYPLPVQQLWGNICANARSVKQQCIAMINSPCSEKR